MLADEKCLRHWIQVVFSVINLCLYIYSYLYQKTRGSKEIQVERWVARGDVVVQVEGQDGGLTAVQAPGGCPAVGEVGSPSSNC